MTAPAPPLVQADPDELLEAIAVEMDAIIATAIAVRREIRFHDIKALREALMVLRLQVIGVLRNFNFGSFDIAGDE